MPDGIHGGEVTAIVAGPGFRGLATRYNVAHNDAGWSSLVARRAHNPKVVGSNPTPATKKALVLQGLSRTPVDSVVLGFSRCVDGPLDPLQEAPLRCLQ